MAFTPTLKTAYWSLAIAGGCYFAFLSLLLNEKIQRQLVIQSFSLCGQFLRDSSALYAHKVQAWWQNLDEPEQWGFLSESQTFLVTAFLTDKPQRIKSKPSTYQQPMARCYTLGIYYLSLSTPKMKRLS